MNEYELQEIWKKNLREFNDVMRLDSIIIRAMQEAIKDAQTKQCNIADVVGQSEQLSCGRNITTCVFYKEGGKCSNLEYCKDQTT